MKSPRIIDGVIQGYEKDVLEFGGGWSVSWTVMSADILFQLSRMQIPYFHVDGETSIPFLTDNQKQVLKEYIDLPFEPVINGTIFS